MTARPALSCASGGTCEAMLDRKQQVTSWPAAFTVSIWILSGWHWNAGVLRTAQLHHWLCCATRVLTPFGWLTTAI